MMLRRCAGLSLPEVLISMGLGLGLVLAVATLHARVLVMSMDTTRAADAQDTLRIALAVLEYDIQHAGYWGLVPDASLIAGRRDDALPLAVTVSGDCAPGWAIDLDRAVETWPTGWPPGCSPYGGLPPVGAALVLRRTGTQLSSPAAGLLQVQSDPWSGRLTAAGEPPDPGAEVRDLVARAYYVSPRSTGDARRPSLRRKTLQRGPRIVDEEIVPGIAGIDIELGIDTDLPGTPGYGQANFFAPPGGAGGEVVAIRITLRADDPARMSATRTIALRNGPAT